MGLIVDPFNNRKTKLDFSIGRFYEHVPLDIAVRVNWQWRRELTGAFYADPGPGAQPNLATSNYAVPGGSIAFQGTGGLTPIAGGTERTISG